MIAQKASPAPIRSVHGGRHAVILCHPDIDSFNHALAKAYCDAVRAAGQSVIVRDLYAMGFDPVLKAREQPTRPDFAPSADVIAERDAIDGCDAFVLIFPIWFGSPPAMMKGYLERVFGAGVRPEHVETRTRTSLLGDKRLLTIATSAMDSIWLGEQGQEQGMRSVFDQYVAHAFGMHAQEHLRFSHVTAKLTSRFADQYRREVADKARRLCAQIAFGDDALLRDPSLVGRVGR